ncbi:hypothetical protein [Desulfoluna spongiiphila]|uniref:hypothetical protein n=1 Tax=Desulfoluna spongiiphila TaxID=419481 RepID=UPI001D024D10|nr:hypothetical protein [Desulfoluna spongiiphila]
MDRLVLFVTIQIASGGSLFEKSSAKTFRLHRLLPLSPDGAERQKAMYVRLI